jgi:hypothetical protein
MNRILLVTAAAIVGIHFSAAACAGQPLQVGFAEADITPPMGFPMAGYYHERLADGTIDPLKAKAVVFRGDDVQAALVICDLAGISVDLATEVRRRAAEKTGIPAANIIVSATHSHTAPDYSKELYLVLARKPRDERRTAYIERLLEGPAEAIAKAHQAAAPLALYVGAARQEKPVSFNRRFVMRDGSVRTWMNFQNPDVLRAAGPIDPEIGILMARSDGGAPRGVLSSFALHLDTVGGLKWSADYPFFIEQALRKELGPEIVSVFGTGCCGDINHVDPRRSERNKTDFIGSALGATIVAELGKLRPLSRTDLRVGSKVVRLPLQEVAPKELARAVRIVEAANRPEKVDFFDHVTAYKQLILDRLRHREPRAESDLLSWGLTHQWAGVGDALPVEVHAICIGDEVAMVCLPGEVFVELGLAIKQLSPFRTTLVIELSNCVETIYIPTRAAYAQGSYEVTNSTLQPGSGEMLVEAALSLLRKAAVAAKEAR